jgi:hypothetical protein
MNQQLFDQFTFARSVSITQEQSKSWDASRHLGHVAKMAPGQTTWPQHGCHSGFVWNWGIPPNCIKLPCG